MESPRGSCSNASETSETSEMVGGPAEPDGRGPMLSPGA